MTRREVYNKIKESAQPIYGDREAGAIARAVVEHLYGWHSAQWVVEPDALVEQLDELESVCTQIAAGVPVQYALGVAQFCGHSFAVREGVLIPRPETEELVGWIVAEHPTGRLLDIGTGSGCIAVSISKATQMQVLGVDVSSVALEVASENAHTLATEVEFEHIDILLPDPSWVESSRGRYDVIVSNPPYVPESDRLTLLPHVLDHEPHGALFVPDADPLLFYRAIAELGQTLLAPQGRLYFEIYESFAPQITELLEQRGYSDIEVRRDIFDKQRMIRGRKADKN